MTNEMKDLTKAELEDILADLRLRYDAERHNHEEDNQFFSEERKRYRTALNKIREHPDAASVARHIATEALDGLG